VVRDRFVIVVRRLVGVRLVMVVVVVVVVVCVNVRDPVEMFVHVQMGELHSNSF
jgi:hypothetical protein